MCRAIAEAHRVDEAKDYRDKAEALRAYAKQANNRDAEVQFAEIKVRAEMKCGELLRDMAERGERRTGAQGQSEEASQRVRLADVGVTEKESSRFQQAASAPREAVEEAFAEARRTQVPVTSAQVRALTKQPEFTPDQRADHERLWRVLRAVEQISEQDITPDEWLEKLPDFMQRRFVNHLKTARPWLERLFKLWDENHAE
jgi:phage-related minor tail protein